MPNVTSKPSFATKHSNRKNSDLTRPIAGRALPGKTLREHCHGVARTLIFADQDRSRLEPPVEFRPRLPASQSVEEFFGFAIKAAEGPLLDTMRDPTH